MRNLFCGILVWATALGAAEAAMNGPPVPAACAHAIEEALYRMEVQGDVAAGRILLSGVSFGGAARAVPLFGADVVVSRVARLKGGALARRDGRLCLVPKAPGPFQVSLDVLIRLRGDRRARVLRFRVPEAVRNGLSLELPRGHRVLSHPGIADEDGTFHFAAVHAAEVRFAAGDAVPAAPRVDAAKLSTVATPRVVLDALQFFTAFEEGGGALSVLRMELPPEAGRWLRIRRVAGAEIWSLRVNGRKEALYALDDEHWVVALPGDAPASVELAFLRRGGKLGLRGRLEVALPATGMPARNVIVGVALPERVELMAVEGHLAPAPGAGPAVRAVPAEFIGRRHFFRRAFYSGDGLQAAFYFREPPKTEEGGA
jgi:hypothetical protein